MSQLTSPSLWERTVVVVGGCGGTDSSIYASIQSSPFFPLSLNVVNEWKSS